MSSVVRQAASSGRAITRAAEAHSATRSRRVALRVTLQVILLGLLLITVLVIGVVNYLSASRTTDVLEQEILSAAARAVEARVQAYLEPGPRTLTDLETRAENGRLPLDDFEALGGFFADRLRYESTLGRLQYADAATGTLVSA